LTSLLRVKGAFERELGVELLGCSGVHVADLDRKKKIRELKEEGKRAAMNHGTRQVITNVGKQSMSRPNGRVEMRMSFSKRMPVSSRKESAREGKADLGLFWVCHLEIIPRIHDLVHLVIIRRVQGFGFRSPCNHPCPRA